MGRTYHLLTSKTPPLSRWVLAFLSVCVIVWLVCQLFSDLFPLVWVPLGPPKGCWSGVSKTILFGLIASDTSNAFEDMLGVLQVWGRICYIRVTLARFSFASPPLRRVKPGTKRAVGRARSRATAASAVSRGKWLGGWVGGWVGAPWGICKPRTKKEIYLNI